MSDEAVGRSFDDRAVDFDVGSGGHESKDKTEDHEDNADNNLVHWFPPY